MDMVNIMLRRGHETSWNDEMLKRLQSQFAHFEYDAQKAFPIYK